MLNMTNQNDDQNYKRDNPGCKINLEFSFIEGYYLRSESWWRGLGEWSGFSVAGSHPRKLCPYSQISKYNKIGVRSMYCSISIYIVFLCDFEHREPFHVIVLEHWIKVFNAAFFTDWQNNTKYMFAKFASLVSDIVSKTEITCV